MCSNFRDRRRQKLFYRLMQIFQRTNFPRKVLVAFLLLLQLTHSHKRIESMDENGNDYIVSSLNKNYNHLSHKRNSNERASSSISRSLRFSNFEPRSLNENTWSDILLILTRDRTTETAKKSIESVKSETKKRGMRGIHLQAERGDVSVNLEFVVPFIRIPVRRSFEMTQSVFRKLAELKANTLLLGGGIAIALSLIVAIVKMLSASTIYGAGYRKATRAANFSDDLYLVSYAQGIDENFTTTKSDKITEDILNNLEQSLYVAKHINVTACAQHAICSYLRRVTKVVQSGNGSPSERIFDGLSNLDLLTVYLNGTAIMDAIESGRKNYDSTCDGIYRDCKWTNLQIKAMKSVKQFISGNLLKFW